MCAKKSQGNVCRLKRRVCGQGCQMVYFQTKNPIFGKFWRVLQWKMLVYFVSILSIFWSLGQFSDHLVNFIDIWYVVPRDIWQPWSAPAFVG
jgi:hypothetical protein